MDMLIMFREDPALAAGYFADYVGHTGVIAGRARRCCDKLKQSETPMRLQPRRTARNLKRSLETSIVTVPPLA
jgi:hypothetical protein